MALNLSLNDLQHEIRYYTDLLKRETPGSAMYEVASSNLKLLKEQLDEARISLSDL